MDLTEHELTESERILRRQGIAYCWSPQPPAQQQLPPNAAPSALQPDEPNTTKQLKMSRVLQALFHGKQPPVHSIWTAAQLYDDLHSVQRPHRLEIFRKIQAAAQSHLHWPAESIAEWPLDPDLHVFAHGISFFCPQLILCFGTYPPLVPRIERQKKGEEFFQGIRIYFLPDLERMAAGDQDAKNHAWKILQNVPKP